MPHQSTQSQRRFARSAPTSGRFARGASQNVGRFGRGGAPSGGRFARSGAPSGGRFGRGGAPSGGRFGRGGAPSRYSRPTPVARHRPSLLHRKQQSGRQKAIASVTAILGGAKGRRRSSGAARGRRAGGMALLAGAAGLAMKNRDKIVGMMGGGKRSQGMQGAPGTQGGYAPPEGMPPA
jgi:hypothetical protein